MPPKRKRSSVVVAQKSNAEDSYELNGRSKKRIRKGTTQKKPRRTIDTTVEWKVRDIIGETQTHYHIDWEDDSVTGEKYDPTWEVKEFANALAVAAWEAQKASRRAAAGELVEGADEEKRATLLVKLQTTPVRPRKRARKIPLSSPEDQPSPAASAIAPSLETDEDLEIDESQPQDLGPQLDTVSSPLFEATGYRSPTSPAAGPRLGIVHVPEPSSSWQAGAYEKITSSQLDHSSHQPASPRTDSPQQSSIEPSQYFVDPDDNTKATQEDTSASNVYSSAKNQDRVESNTTSQSVREGSAPNNADNHSGDSTQSNPDNSSKVTQEGSTSSNVNSSLAEPTRTTAVNSRNEFTFIVPDSQSISESASFVPSGRAEDSRTTDTTADHSGTSLQETLDPAVTASRPDNVVEVNATAEPSIERSSSLLAGNQAENIRDSTAGAELSALDSPGLPLGQLASLNPEHQPGEEAQQSPGSLQDTAPPHAPIEILSSNPESTGRSLLNFDFTSQIDESTRPDRGEYEPGSIHHQNDQLVGKPERLQHPDLSGSAHSDHDPTQSRKDYERAPSSSAPIRGLSTEARSRLANEVIISIQRSAEHTPDLSGVVSNASVSSRPSQSQHSSQQATPGADFQTQLPLDSEIWRSTESQYPVGDTSPAAEEASKPSEDRVKEVSSHAILPRLPNSANVTTPAGQQASALYHHRQWTLSLVTNSSFPFQTQFVDLETPGKLGTGLNPTVSGIGRQRSPFASGQQSTPVQAPPPDYTHRTLVKQLLSSSPIPPVPSQSIEVVGDSAPQAPTTLSSILTTPTRSLTRLKPSRSPSEPRTPFAARLKAKKEARRAQREASEAASVRSSSVVSAMEPAKQSEAAALGSESEPRPSTPPAPALAPQSQVEHQAVDATSTPSQSISSAMEPATSPEAAVVYPERKWKATTPPPPAPTSHTEGAASDAPVPILTVEPASALPAHMASPAYSGSRSPSVVPAERFIPAMTREEQNESERYYTLVPQASQDSTNGDRRESLVRSPVAAFNHSANHDAEHESVHEIPIALIGHQRDQHYQTLYYHQEAMRKFLEEGGKELQLEADAFCDCLRRILLHPDLDNAETLTQYNVEPIRQMQWDVNCSAKFHFLFELIRSLDGEPLHIAIVAGSGRIVSMMDTFLTGLSIPHDIRSDSPQPAVAGLEDDKLRCSIIDTDARDESLPKADFVIVLDPRIRCNSPRVKSLRRLQGKRGIAPVVSLIVPYSLEHIEHSISSTVDDATRLRTIINNIYEMRDEAGRLEEGVAHPATVAAAVARYFTDEAPWTVASLDPLDNLTSQTESEIECAGSPHAGTKRPAEAVEDLLAEDAAKKPRLMESTKDIATSTDPQEIRTTHVSDSVSQSVHEMTDEALDSRETERKLRDLLKKSQDRTDEHVAALSDLQYRHEDQFKELHELRQERDQGVETAQRALERMNEQASSLMSTKAERNALRDQLEEANTKLLSDAIPERAELEAFRLAAERANAEKTKADARVELMKRDLAFAQQQYQNSSQSASQLASQVSDMERQLVDLTAKASGEQARLRSLGYDAYLKNLQRENKQLKARLQDRELALKFKDEEIARMKEAGRGRMGTRNSSVPRSPRLGSPMKFTEGGVSRGNGGGGGAGSRQASPAAGELRARGSNLNPTRGARY